MGSNDELFLLAVRTGKAQKRNINSFIYLFALRLSTTLPNLHMIASSFFTRLLFYPDQT